MAQDVTKDTSQYIDNKSFNPTFGLHENLVYGYDGTNAVSVKVTADGKLETTGSGISSDATNYQIAGGPQEDTGYNYIGYQNTEGAWYIKRQNLTTFIWSYTKGTTDFAGNWTNKTGLSYNDWDHQNLETASITVPANTVTMLTDENGVQSQMLGDTIYPGAPVMIDVAHHEIHCGDSVTYSEVTDIANGQQRNILLVVPTPTPGTKRYHLTVDIESESECDYKLYEDTTTSNNGTGVTAYNRNRQDPVVVPGNEIVFTHTPTVTGVGTLLENLHWGSGRGVGGSVRGDSEWILKNNTKYLIRITNATTNPNQVAIKLNYYVHPGI